MSPLTVGLKEWAIVCDLLLEGRTIILLRKGGIHERTGPGVFTLEHPAFLLFPSWEHQKPAMVKEEFRGRVEVRGEPAETAGVTFHGWGEAARIWRVPDRAAMEKVEDLHVWTPAQIDMRFNYKPENPLYLVAVRSYRLKSPVARPGHWSYAGCKSWVPLKGEAVEIQSGGLTPAIDDAEFAAMTQRIDVAMR
ncbi:MAG: DUF1802 family protein [Planctomycetes bacterium]|nr:DUF1802 family protein [Planctomycetota bacterium]